MSVRSNISEVNAYYKSLDTQMKPQTLELESSMEYAQYLQDKEGYYVFSDEVSRREVRDTMNEVARAIPLTPTNVGRGLEAAGWKIIGYLRSLTSKQQPPIKAGEGWRAAHPGGWADRTGNLNISQRFRVNRGAWNGQGAR
jgi:hypothetical protein